MTSITRRLALGTFAGLALALLLWLTGSMALAAIPAFPAEMPLACAGVGFACAIGSALAKDILEDETEIEV